MVNLDTVKDLTYTVSALADEAAVVEFRASADVLIAVRLPVGHQTADEWPVLTEVEDSRTVAVAKTLMLTGIVEVDSFRRPVSDEVSSVRAREDDPGLAAWVTRSAARASASLSETLEAAYRSLEPSEAIRKVMAGLDTSGLDAIRKMSEPSEATRQMMAGLDTSGVDAIYRAAASKPFARPGLDGEGATTDDAGEAALTEPMDPVAKWQHVRESDSHDSTGTDAVEHAEERPIEALDEDGRED